VEEKGTVSGGVTEKEDRGVGHASDVTCGDKGETEPGEEESGGGEGVGVVDDGSGDICICGSDMRIRVLDDTCMNVYVYVI